MNSGCWIGLSARAGTCGSTLREEWHLRLRVGCRPERLTKMRFCSFRNSPAALPPKRRLRSAGGVLCRQITLLAYLKPAWRPGGPSASPATWLERSASKRNGAATLAVLSIASPLSEAFKTHAAVGLHVTI